MFVRFHSKVGGFTIQGDIATTLLRLMGMSGDVPGALLAKDVPQALERLKKGVAPEKAQAPAGEDEGERGNRVSLATRAFPLVQLLENAVKRDSDVVWEELRRSTG
jgi:hypothetical protein